MIQLSCLHIIVIIILGSCQCELMLLRSWVNPIDLRDVNCDHLDANPPDLRVVQFLRAYSG